MAEKSTPEIILEFVKIFIWPTLAVIAVLWLGPDLKEILKSRTWKIGIIEVGDRVSNLEETLTEELMVQQKYLDEILKNPGDAGQVEGYATQAKEAIQNAQEGVRKEIRNIRETLPEQQFPAEPAKEAPLSGTRENPTTARGWERLGFEYLIDRNVQAATEAFSEAQKIWPDYHNVSEIRSLLVQRQDELKKRDAAGWETIYKEILARYSWGMPLDVREQMQVAVGEN